jgi:hypothetical protein
MDCQRAPKGARFFPARRARRLDDAGRGDGLWFAPSASGTLRGDGLPAGALGRPFFFVGGIPMILRPRWLMVSMIPLFALAMEWLLPDVGHINRTFAKAHGASSSSLMVVHLLVTPLLTASTFVYPLARLYGRYAVAVAALVGLYATWSQVGLGDLRVGLFMGSLMFWTSALMMFATHVCRFWLAGSDLAIVPGDGAAHASPKWLMLTILPLAAQALYNLELTWGPPVSNALLALAGDSALAWRVAAILSHAVIAALMALVFAYPIARPYARRARLAALAVAMPCALYWASFALDAARTGHPIRTMLYLVEGVSLLALVPVAAWWVQRRLADSRLAVVRAGSMRGDVPDDEGIGSGT